MTIEERLEALENALGDSSDKEMALWKRVEELAAIVEYVRLRATQAVQNTYALRMHQEGAPEQARAHEIDADRNLANMILHGDQTGIFPDERTPDQVEEAKLRLKAMDGTLDPMAMIAKMLGMPEAEIRDIAENGCQEPDCEGCHPENFQEGAEGEPKKANIPTNPLNGIFDDPNIH